MKSFILILLVTFFSVSSVPAFGQVLFTPGAIDDLLNDPFFEIDFLIKNQRGQNDPAALRATILKKYGQEGADYFDISIKEVYASDMDFRRAKTKIKNRIKNAQRLSRHKKFGEAIEMLELLNRELESKPKLKRSFDVTGAIDKIRKEQNSPRNLCKQAEADLEGRHTDVACSAVGTVGFFDKMKVDVGLKLMKTCEEETHERISELDSNLEAKGLPIDSCRTLEGTRLTLTIGLSRFDEHARGTYTCGMFEKDVIRKREKQRELSHQELMAPAWTPSEHQNLKNKKAYTKKVIRLEREQIQKFDQDIKEFGLDVNLCPSVIQTRAAYVKNLERSVAADKRVEDNRKIKEEQRANAIAQLEASVDVHYKSGLFKKFTADDLKEEEEDRRSSMVKRGLPYQEWLKENKRFASDNAAKLKELKYWEGIYLNYMMVKICDKNQGKYDLIRDMTEMKAKMKVIDMMMPLQIDPDVLWSRVEGSEMHRQFQDGAGLMSHTEFAEKMASTCGTGQKLLRYMHNEFTKLGAVKKRERSKKDF
jgi:hypothetical protein